MCRRAAVLLAALLAAASIVGAHGSAASDAEAEELFLSAFSEPAGERTSDRTLAWLVGQVDGVVYGTYGDDGGYGGYGSYGGYGGYGGSEPSPSPSPTPSPESSPSPSPSPDASPSPSPSPSPNASPSPSPSPDTCHGVAYSGYLTGCTVWADTNADGTKAAGEPSAAIAAGQFAFAAGTTPSNLGVLYVSTADEATKAVTNSSAVCHDATSLLAVHFPFAAPRPTSCSSKLVISPLTTLLTYASGLTPAALLEATHLPATFELLTTDSLAAALAGDSDANQVYRREVQLTQVVLLGAHMLTDNATHLADARKAVLASLAATAGSTAGSRHLLADTTPQTLNLTSGSLVEVVLQLANQLADASIPPADLIELEAGVLHAVSNAIATINNIIETSDSIDAIQEAAYVAQTYLLDNIDALMAGELSLDDFLAATSADELLSVVDGTTVPGTPPSENPPASPSPSPSPSNNPTDTNPSPSPSNDPSDEDSGDSDPTDTSASPSPSPSPSPSTSPSPDLPLCQGVAYDGYLTSCTVWADTNSDGTKAASEPSAAITAGQFAFAAGTTPSNLGVLYVSTADEATKTVASGSAVCHDATSLLAVHFPFAAPRPTSCSTKLVISPLTTLLTYAQAYSSGLTPATLLEAVALPTTFNLMTTDSLAASASGNSDGKRVYCREAQLQQLVLVGANLLTNNTAYLPAARKAVLRSLASSVVPTSAGRRLLADAAVQSLDFTSGALVQQMVQLANTLAAASIPSTELTTLSSAVLEAVANSMAAMNSLIETSSSVEDVMKASVASQTVLSENVAKLATGAISLSTFQTATSEAALKDAVQQATLPGTPITPATTATPKKSNRAVALGVGLGVGLGVPAVAAAVAYFLWWKPAHAASSGLASPML